MEFIDQLKGVDIYLIDQLMKGNINSEHKVLDAGCGRGRNLSWFIKNNIDIVGVDPDEESINQLKVKFPEQSSKIIISSIEDYINNEGFDVVICNAVLHFAKDHQHFDRMFNQLHQNLKVGGLLFIRMTSDIGMSIDNENKNGVYLLPDNTDRYLITKERIAKILHDFSYKLIEPIKTVNVNDLRYMTTLVLRK